MPSTMYTTMMAMISSTARLPSELWNALAAPWNCVLMVSGSSRSAMSLTWSTTSPSAAPGFRLNEIVAAGSWP